PGQVQPRSPRNGPRALLPRRPLLSAERLPDPPATAARAPGRHPGARALLRGSIRPADAAAHRGGPGRGARDHAAMDLAWQRPRAGQPHRTSDDHVAWPEARNTSRRARAYRVPSRAVEWHGDARSAGAGTHPTRPRGSELVDRRSAGCRCPPRDEADHAAVVDQEARDHEAHQIAIRRQLNPASSPRAARRARERLAGASSPQCATLVGRCVPGRAVGKLALALHRGHAVGLGPRVAARPDDGLPPLRRIRTLRAVGLKVASTSTQEVRTWYSGGRCWNWSRESPTMPRPTPRSSPRSCIW